MSDTFNHFINDEKWFAAYALAQDAMDGKPVPATITLEQILAALQIIAKIIPILDGLLPTFIRWWKELFGTKEERAAVKAYKVLRKAEAVLRAQNVD